MYERVVGYVQGLSYLTVARFLLLAFLVVFPFQIRTLIFNLPFFPTGNFNAYASFFIYLSDLLLLGAFVLYGLGILQGEVKRKIEFGSLPFTVGLLLLLLAFSVTVFWSEFRLLSLWQVFRFGELFLLYFLLVNEVLNRREVLQFFLVGMMVQGVVALGQYIFQSSLGLRFLGEPVIGSDVPGVAKIDMDGGKLVRSYGTLPHPNVLGGMVSMGLLWGFYLLRKNMWWMIGVGAVLLMTLLFTFSRSAFLAIAGGLLVYFSLTDRKLKFKQVFLWGSVILFLIVLFNLEGVLVERVFMGNDAQSGLERMQYMNVSKQMMIDHPLGVGLGHFTLYMQDYTLTDLAPWIMQPVHNAFLLLINEVGIVVGLFFLALLGYLFFSLLTLTRKTEDDERLFVYLSLTILTMIFVISLFDHYFVTLYQGQVVLFIYFGLASNALSDSRLPRKKS